MATLFVDKLDPQSGTALEIGSSGDTITIPSGATIVNSGTQTGFGGANTPAFLAYLGSDQGISNDTTTVLNIDTEVYDTASAYNTGTYKFIPQTAGKYFVYGIVYVQSAQANNYYYGWGGIKLNSTTLIENINDGRDDASGRAYQSMMSTTCTMNGSTDFLQITGYLNAAITDSGIKIQSGRAGTQFGAYKIIE